MFMNTFLKKFLAECAARVAAAQSECYTVSDLLDDGNAEAVAIAAVNVAKQTALKLEEYWRSNGDHQTTMFDPDDSEYDQIVKAIDVNSEAVDDVKETINRLVEIAEGKGKIIKR